MIGQSLMIPATDTLTIKLLGTMLRVHAGPMGAILYPFILSKKTTSFINSAPALQKTSGLVPLTLTRTDTGTGQTGPAGPMLIGQEWTTEVTGGSTTVATCLLRMAP